MFYWYNTGILVEENLTKTGITFVYII